MGGSGLGFSWVIVRLLRPAGQAGRHSQLGHFGLSKKKMRGALPCRLDKIGKVLVRIFGTPILCLDSLNPRSGTANWGSLKHLMQL